LPAIHHTGGRQANLIEIGRHCDQHCHDMAIGDVPMFGQLIIGLANRFVERVDEQTRV
jgi:hypothetical protein